ncbi:MAG TPA: CsbD family protein [Nitriliruptoraceae bacterium]|nr:CsbD family protein [Nitriliruptoraceae bacterium]
MGGESDKAKGRVKQAAGDLTDNDELEREGERDEAAGKAKDKLDDMEQKGRDAVDSVKEKMNRND